MQIKNKTSGGYTMRCQQGHYSELPSTYAHLQLNSFTSYTKNLHKDY